MQKGIYAVLIGIRIHFFEILQAVLRYGILAVILAAGTMLPGAVKKKERSILAT